jgi:hypothetical protein
VIESTRSLSPAVRGVTRRRRPLAGALQVAAARGEPLDGREREPVAGCVGCRRAAVASDARGQVAVLLVGGLLAVGLGALVLGAVARGLGTRDAAQRAADLAALAGARAMHASYDRLFEPARLRGRPNPRHLEKDAYVGLGRAAAIRVAAANGAPGATVSFPDGATFAPVRVRVAVERRLEIAGEGVGMRADAEAELAPPAGAGPAAFGSGGGYDGPLSPSQTSHSGRRQRGGQRSS